jgi:DNA-binding transcriptional LysR family regulator
VASPDYVEQHPAVTRPEDLLEHQCMTYWLNHERVFWRFRVEGRELELPIPRTFSSNNGLVLLQMARQGKGIALLDDYTVAEDLAAGALVQLLPDVRVTNATFEEGIFVTYLETPFLPAKLRLYIDFVVAHWGDALPGKGRKPTTT